MTHASGHGSRLDREGVTQRARSGSELYSKEELIAELGAAFLSNEAGILDSVRFENLGGLPSPRGYRSLKTIPA
jgi:antirestriction protein ArdC